MKYGDVFRDARPQEVERTLIVMFVGVAKERSNGSDHVFLVLEGSERAFVPGEIKVWTADDWEPVS